MVIWDLDDSFWEGTLGEGQIKLNQTNIGYVKELGYRGIVSSIASKSNFERSKNILVEAGIWDFFVFPTMGATSKAFQIKNILKKANLRAENILFIDNENNNLNEVLQYFTGINAFHPKDIVASLLTLPQLQGLPDPSLKRLNQFKQLERKVGALSQQSYSAEEFLRSSQIKVRIDYNVGSHINRIVELLNRTNQLNFTKKRITSDESLSEFRKSMEAYGAKAAVVSVEDKFGDYGIIGFFHLSVSAAGRQLVHFVFSCRIMNMGIEQFIYEKLDRPDCEIVTPIANPIEVFRKVDWIEEPLESALVIGKKRTDKVILLGGCELLQIGSYCSNDRSEYVNTMRESALVRYDDFGFILSEREALRRSTNIASLASWLAADTERFDRDLMGSKLVIVALGMAMAGDYVFLESGIFFRIAPDENGMLLLDSVARITNNYKIVKMSIEQKLELLERSLRRISILASKAECRLLVGANTRTVGSEELRLNSEYNRFVKKYCAENKDFHFLSIDKIIPESEILDNLHFSRYGYSLLAEEIFKQIG